MNFSSERIAALRRGSAQQVAVRAVAETGSTNADLLAALATMTAPTLLIAERQTAGRGRAGRVWHSAPGASLTCSLAWKFGRPLQALVGLPLAVGVAIAETLALFEVPVQLKWPNDVLHEGRKLGGILIETSGARDTSWAVIGIGLNLAMPSSMAERIGRPVAGAAQLAEADCNVLAAALLNALAEAAVLFEQEGLAAFLARWNALHAYAGQPVAIVDGERLLHEGRAIGIDESGRFVMDTAAGRIAVMAGDVSLRAKDKE